MTTFVRSTVAKTRDKFLSSVLRILGQISSKLSDVAGQIQEIRQSQLQINHYQLELLEETNKRVKNTGTLVLSEKEMVAKIFSGLKISLDPRDLAVAQHLALDGIWEHRITMAWLSVVQSHDTVLDVGANFGYYGVLAAQKTDKKHSKVVMFEANPKLIPYINRTLSLNWLHEQCTTENLAIAETKKKVRLHVLKDYVGSSSLYDTKFLDTYMHNKMPLAESESVSVDATTIDEYCLAKGIKSVDLIKVDIEGYEDLAYEGMRETVKMSPNLTMFLEFTRQAYKDPEAFYNQLLNDFGNVYVIGDDGSILRPKNSDYASVIGDNDDWVMPIFSKNSKLMEISN